MNRSNDSANSYLLPLHSSTWFSHPSKNRWLTLTVHPWVIQSFQCIRNLEKRERRYQIVDAATHCIKPLFCPYLFAGLMVRTVWLTIKVGGKEGWLASCITYIKTDGFFGGGNELIEWKGKGVCTFICIMLKRGSNELSDSSFNPDAEIVFLSQ